MPNARNEEWNERFGASFRAILAKASIISEIAWNSAVANKVPLREYTQPLVHPVGSSFNGARNSDV